MSENAALKALKTRRRPRGANARPTPEELVEQREPGTPPLKRSMPFLFDPAEMPVVVESGGHVPPADFAKYYVIAEHDAAEQFVPDGCRTAVMRTLWLRGQHVRRDVYLGWLRDNNLLPEETVEDSQREDTAKEGETHG
jgi:hypothetical protein